MQQALAAAGGGDASFQDSKATSKIHSTIKLAPPAAPCWSRSRQTSRSEAAAQHTAQRSSARQSKTTSSRNTLNDKLRQTSISPNSSGLLKSGPKDHKSPQTRTHRIVIVILIHVLVHFASGALLRLPPVFGKPDTNEHSAVCAGGPQRNKAAREQGIMPLRPTQTSLEKGTAGAAEHTG